MSRKEREEIRERLSGIFAKLLQATNNDNFWEVEHLFMFLRQFNEVLNLKILFNFGLKELGLSRKDFNKLKRFASKVQQRITVK